MTKVENVIWISSYPKSGNTWVHSVLKSAGAHDGFPQVDMDVYKLLRSNGKLAFCPMVNRKVSEKGCTVLKTHAKYSERLHPDIGLKTTGFCHILRNPLDILLSSINFSRIQYGNRKGSLGYRKELFVDFLGFEEPIPYNDWKDVTLDDIPQANLDHALNFFIQNEGNIPFFYKISGSWFEHAESWMGKSSLEAGVHLKYEDLLERSEEFLKLQDLFDIQTDKIMTALLQLNERDKKMRNDPKQPLAKIFYNKMSSYYYLDYFSKSKVKDFLTKFEPQLTAVGYSNLPY